MKIQGIVGKGRQQGRKIGFPTANILTTSQDSEHLEELEFGIYAGKINVQDQWYVCAISYGQAPTFKVNEITLEAHIIDFAAEIYKQKVELQIEYFLRPIETYSSLDALKIQIEKDCIRAKTVIML